VAKPIAAAAGSGQLKDRARGRSRPQMQLTAHWRLRFPSPRDRAGTMTLAGGVRSGIPPARGWGSVDSGLALGCTGLYAMRYEDPA
jgi:hypothetical protein